MKSLILAAVLTAASLFVPVQATPSTCWIAPNLGVGAPKGEPIEPQQCDVAFTTNSQGHKVVEITSFSDMVTARLIFWFNQDETPNYVELMVNGKRSIWKFRFDDAGDVHVYHDSGAEFYFALPGAQPRPTRPADVFGVGSGITA
jgi:hypothetical protein